MKTVTRTPSAPRRRPVRFSLPGDYDVRLASHEAAAGYYQRHRTEVEALIAANEAMGFDEVKRLLPQVRRQSEIPA